MMHSNKNNSIPNSSVSYNLLEPTTAVPWSMDVVSMMPQEVLSASATAVSGASQGRWHALLSSDDTSCVYLWYTSPSLKSLVHQKESQSFWKLPFSYDNNVATSPPLLALQSSLQSPDLCHLYICHPTTGELILWEVAASSLSLFSSSSPQQQQQQQQPTATATLPLALDDTITCLNVENTLLLVGTQLGYIFWVEQTPIPVALHVQPVQVSEEEEQQQGGLLSRLLYTPSKKRSLRLEEQQQKNRPVLSSPVIANLVWCDDSDNDTTSTRTTTTFVSVAQDATVLLWTARPTESHKVLFEAPHKLPFADNETNVLQAAVQGRHLHMLLTDAQRVYWAYCNLLASDEQKPSQELQCLTRFASPDMIQEVIGMMATQDGLAYAILVVTSGAPLFVAWQQQGQQQVLYEADLVLQPPTAATNRHTTLIPGTLTADIATHGVCVWEASGVAIRGRLRVAATTASTSFSSTPNPGAIPMLLQHLRFFFWNAYTQPNNSSNNMNLNHSEQLPPSLEQADLADLEVTVVTFAQELLQQASTAASNPLELHLALIRLLQQTAVYRTLSTLCRWKLLAIGQETSVLLAVRPPPAEDGSATPPLQDVAAWLQATHNVTAEDAQQAAFLPIFCAAVDAAMDFREDHASPTYDVVPNQLPPNYRGVWTSQLMPIWTRQLEYWQQQQASSSTMMTSAHRVAAAGIPPKILQTFCSSYLQACSDAHGSCPHDTDIRDTLVRAQRQCFDLLRLKQSSSPSSSSAGDDSNNSMDRYVFELCMAHHFFGGLCQISLDHEQRGDRTTFALEEWLQGPPPPKNDTATDLPLGAFVLRWFTDRGHYGHVLRYGAYVPDVLAQMLQTEAVLRPYQWIHAVRMGDYSQATDSLFANGRSQEARLSDAAMCLSAAKLGSRMVDPPSSQRSRKIEQHREWIVAQQQLLGEDAAEDAKVWTSQELLEHTLQKLDQTTVAADQAEVGVIGLAVCAAMEEDSSFAQQAAAQVWARIIAIDNWQGWIQDSIDLTDERLRESIRQNTVFGLLLEQVEEAGMELEGVIFRHPAVERAVLTLLNDMEGKMARLLRSVTETAGDIAF